MKEVCVVGYDGVIVKIFYICQCPMNHSIVHRIPTTLSKCLRNTPDQVNVIGVRYLKYTSIYVLIVPISIILHALYGLSTSEVSENESGDVLGWWWMIIR